MQRRKDMKRSLAFVLSASFLVLLLAGACNNSVDSMLDDYNGGFNTGYVYVQSSEIVEDEPLSPGDDGFDPEKMLRDVYPVQADSTLILAGPPNNVYSYDWMVYGPISVNVATAETHGISDGINYGEDEKVDVKPFNGTLNSRKFIIYLPQSGLEVDKTYKLTLSIVTQGGIFYSDSCSIVVYPHATYKN